MAEKRTVRVCEVQEEACKRDVQALCYHCSKNLCRVHLVRHAQLMEDKIKAELNALTDKFNQVSSRFNDLVFSEQILEEPLAQLEQWSTIAHDTIDQMVKDKREELHQEFDKYRQTFLQNNEQQLMKLNASKKTLKELIDEADASANQIADLQRSIDEIETYLNNQTMPLFNIIAQPVNWPIDIHTNSSKTSSATLVDPIQEFQITYVRLTGQIRNYFIKTNRNGTIGDLISSFIRLYIAMEETIRNDNYPHYTIDHLPEVDLILPVEIHNHRVHLQYKSDKRLNEIEHRDVIVFYETPYSLVEPNNTRILMPCLFRNQTSNDLFGLPIYLNVPRDECRGTDIRDAVNETLTKFYTPNFFYDRFPAYTAFLQRTINSVTTETNLDDALNDEFDFRKIFIVLVAAFDGQVVDRTSWNFVNQSRF